MEKGNGLKTIKSLLNQTPLIIDPERDAPTFQTALAAVPTEKLFRFYQDLTHEERRRFHYVANVCLGYEAWSRLYKELVIPETQARISDRLAEVYAFREEELLAQLTALKQELTRLERENQTLQRENLHLIKEVTALRETCQGLERQQQHLLRLLEKYKELLRQAKRFLAPGEGPPREEQSQ